MAEQIGSLYVNMALESANFVSGLKAATAQTERAGAAINNAFSIAKGAVVGFLGALGVDALIGVTQRAFDFSDAIVDLSDKTGASTKFIQEFGYAAQMSGSSVESASAGLEKFTKKLGEAEAGNKTARDELLAYGVTSFDVDTAVRQAADGISQLDSRQKQNAATMDLFGKKAGDLTVLMSGGSAAISDLAMRAQELGIVLADDVLRNAGQVNDQLDTMKMILDAKMANMIVQNADSIALLADKFITLATNISQAAEAWNIYNNMSGFRSGDIGAARSLARTKSGRAAMLNDLDDRLVQNSRDRASGRGQRQTALGGLISWTDGSSPEEDARLDAEFRTLNRQRNAIMRLDQAAARNRTGGRPRGDRDLRNVRVPSNPSAKSKPTPTPVHLLSDNELNTKWADALEAAQNQELSARQAITQSVAERAKLERDILYNESNARTRAIKLDTGSDQEVREGKRRYTKAQADQLLALEDQSYTQQLQLTYLREDEELARQKLSVAQSGLQNDMDLLNGQDELARTANERREIALRLVDLQYRQEKLALDAIVASQTATDAEKQIAQARLNILGQLKGQAEQKAVDSTKSPIDAYLDAIPRTADEMNEAMENVAVDGLDNLKSGLHDCIKGAGDLGDAFSSMADRIIDGLLEIALQQAIIKPLGAALFGGSDGGSGILGSIIQGARAGVTGGKANGGLGNRGRWLVGEHGPEVVEMGGPFKMIPNDKLDGARGSGGGINVTFGAITSNDPEMVKAVAVQAISELKPLLMKQSSDYTISQLRRPRM